MKPGYLTLPTIWRGCTWPAVQLQWLDQDGHPINLFQWVPRASTRHFDLNAVIVDAQNAITQISLSKEETADLRQGIEDWDWVWLKQGASGATLPPMLKGKVAVRHPVTNPEALTVTRIGGGSNYVTIRAEGPHFNLLGHYDQPEYHQTVVDQITNMRANGQNQFSLFVWHVSGLHWPDPEHPSTPPGYYYPNRPWVWLHTLIPWHAVNPYPPYPNPSADVSDATLSPQSRQNLIDLLGLLNDLEFEELHVRIGSQGDAGLPTTDPVPLNDRFVNATVLGSPSIGTVATLEGSTVGATREPASGNLNEPSGGGEATVWYRFVGDGQIWAFNISRPTRATLEAFTGADVYHLTKVTPLPEAASLTFPTGNGTTYYVRVGVSGIRIPFEGDPQGVANMPDYFTLGYARGTSVPQPSYPVLPFPPDGWGDASQEQYEENLAFRLNLAQLVEDNKGGLRVRYDLSPEGANRRTFFSHTHRYYMASLWRDWSAQFGVANATMSALPQGYGIRFMIDLFKQSALSLPGFYAFDPYGHELDGLTRIYNTLKLDNEHRKKIYILETFYNDAQSAADTRKAIRATGANFGGIIQWPRLRTSGSSFPFPPGYPADFSAYINL